MRYIFIILLILCLSPNSVRCQQNWTTGIHVGLGANFFLHQSRVQRFPGLRLFGAVSITGIWKNNLLLHYGPALSMYTGTIGSGMNPLSADLQVDFSHTFSFGWVSGSGDGRIRPIRTLHTGDYYNLILDRKYG